MRVAVTQRFELEQTAAALHQFDEQLAALVYLQAADQRRVGKVTAITADRIDHGQAIVAADDEVVLTMCRCRVHGTRTGLQSDVITQHHRHLRGQEGVSEQ